jgi:bacterioferritin
MQGDPKVIDYLNKGLRSELTAINQYWLHYRVLNNWGLLEMAKQWRKESIEEMHHADRFTDRILFLDGFPNMQVLDPTSPPRLPRAASIRKPRPTATASRTTSHAICSKA